MLTDKQEYTSSKKTGLVAALAIVVCLSAAAVYHRVNNSDIIDEISDGTKQFKAFGYAGYHFQNTPMTWDQSKQWCSDHNMVLATMDEEWKKNKIRELVGNTAVWIGYRSTGAITNKDSYKWVSGAATGYAPWSAGEPNNIAGELCVELFPPHGLLNNNQCGSYRLPFVCDKSPYNEGYAAHGVNGEGIGFDDADAQCRIRYGTGLATLADPKVMKNIIAETQAPNAWIGLRIKPGLSWHKTYFENLSGEPSKYRQNWAENEPNNYGGKERCVHIYANGGLNDLPCDWKLKWYLCDQYRGGTVHSYSTFEINGERKPVKGFAMPAKRILFSGRKSYRLKMKITMHGLRPEWTSIVHVGSANNIRVPGLFQFPQNQRGLHFRQSTDQNWNFGCDPNPGYTPTIGTEFNIDVLSRPNNLIIRYNSFIRCVISGGSVQSVVSPQTVWISDPWHNPAPVTIREMSFVVS